MNLVSLSFPLLGASAIVLVMFKLCASLVIAISSCLPYIFRFNLLLYAAFDKAPMYFRKAIEDATSEWSQHASKRIIETGSKGLRASIPPNFPYFHVEFGLTKGFVHVIDEPSSFPRNFAREVAAGLLDLPPEDASRRLHKESQELQSKWAAEFREEFSPYDWTKELD